ncbi:MAG: DUF2156 domain-containing protein, partial [Clostridiales bacterium]|nr:DUF2156 domain-containing protein [Clostridiales bacterium]
MINFQAPKPSDKPWVDRMLVHATGRGSEFNFTNMYIWNHTFSQRLACVGGFLVVRAIEVMGSGYLWPVGQGDRGAVITALEADAAERGEPFRLICLGRSHVEELEALFPGAFEFATNRNGFDYLYEIDRLADLRGKKLHAKRNHCNRFEAEFPDWKYEDLTPASLEECLVVDREWYLRTKLKEGHTKA